MSVHRTPKRRLRATAARPGSKNKDKSNPSSGQKSQRLPRPRPLQTAKRAPLESLELFQSSFQTFFQSNPIPSSVFRKVGADFVLTHYNQATVEFTHGRVREYLGKSAREIYTERPRVLESIVRCFAEKKTVRFESRYQLVSTGAERVLVFTFAYVPPDGVLLHLENITERRHSEAEHKRAETELQQWNVQLEQRVAEHTVSLEAAKSQFEELNVRLEDEIAERRRAEEETQRLNKVLQQHAHDLENANEELEVSNEELRVANEDLERQIAVREQAEQALRHSESRYHSLFENMLDGFAYCQLLCDDHGHPVDFVYLDVNAAFETLTGLKNVVGKKVTEVIPTIKEEHPELFEIYGRVALSGQPERFLLEFKPLSIWLSLSVYSSERGYFVAVFENITERKRAEQSLRDAMHRIQKLNEDLEQRAAELQVASEELEQLATSLALDLRSPLVSLHSVSRLIAQDYGAQLPPQVQQLFHLIDANAEEMDQLTQGLLQWMRVTRQTLRKQDLNPEEIVRAAQQELQAECAGRRVEITVGHLPICRADPLLLKQVWINLLSNALKFTRPREQARIEIGARLERDRIVYFVKDNGVGFDMSYAGTIFRAFQRYHHVEDGGGSGVGLALVESIIRRHGGRVWAQAQEGQGATFCFTLD